MRIHTANPEISDMEVYIANAKALSTEAFCGSKDGLEASGAYLRMTRLEIACTCTKTVECVASSFEETLDFNATCLFHAKSVVLRTTR